MLISMLIHAFNSCVFYAFHACCFPSPFPREGWSIGRLLRKQKRRDRIKTIITNPSINNFRQALRIVSLVTNISTQIVIQLFLFFVQFNVPFCFFPSSFLLSFNREFKIYDATVAKTSLKIASSSFSIYFAIMQLSMLCPRGRTTG